MKKIVNNNYEFYVFDMVESIPNNYSIVNTIRDFNRINANKIGFKSKSTLIKILLKNDLKAQSFVNEPYKPSTEFREFAEDRLDKIYEEREYNKNKPIWDKLPKDYVICIKD